MNTREKGSIGEDLAVEHLIAQGYTIVSRNYQTRNGEIDCIAKDPNGVLVFLEVKSGSGSKFGQPIFWVTKSKQMKLASMARRYLSEHKFTSQACRFDVIAICGQKIDHLKNAFLA